MRVLTVAGVDPGTFRCGATIIRMNLDTRTIIEIRSETIECDRVFRWNYYDHDLGTADTRRRKRLQGLRLDLLRFFRHERIDVMLVESAYARRKTISALGPLLEAMCYIQDVADELRVGRFIKIAPPEVRAIIGAGPKGKDEILRAVIRIIGTEGIDLRLLDDNAVDSIAIALSFICKHH